MTDNHSTRPLEHVALGISASENDGANDLGFTKREVNRCVREVASAVMTQGGSVVFGHDWRPDGVMSELLHLAIAHHSSDAITTPTRCASMVNFVPWPSRTTVSADDRHQYRDVLHIIEMERPDGYRAPSGYAENDPEQFDIVNRVAALTEMRQKMAQLTSARLCMGGRVSGSGGRYSGIAEEALLTRNAGKPLYLTGLLGGATSELIDAFHGTPVSKIQVFQPRSDVAQAMYTTGLHKEWDVPNFGLNQLVDGNGLTREENDQLFEAKHLGDVIGLVLKGLATLRKAR
ncbi:hypothetical protein [Shimia sp. R9_3]|uniref:hypothetical protein n=1 Tax=Roseobacteraceae TaxID=2854170 RepID=UPI001ADB5654|nr:hypothetical protein [Shimia sp. R9_3]MBO9400520.1 hypothetical protein [Shimia sp. R9_3]